MLYDVIAWLFVFVDRLYVRIDAPYVSVACIPVRVAASHRCVDAPYQAVARLYVSIVWLYQVVDRPYMSLAWVYVCVYTPQDSIEARSPCVDALSQRNVSLSAQHALMH